MKKKHILIVLGFLFTFSVEAQIQTGELPYYFTHNISIDIPIISMPTFDVNILLEEDNENLFHKPYRFAKAFPQNLTTENSGIWVDGEDESRVWFLKIKSERALSIGLVLSNYNLPARAKLFIYSSDTIYVLGALTSENNNENQMLPISFIPGEEIIIEYYEPKDVDFTENFVISSIVHDYRGLYMQKSSQWCEVNINCLAGSDWQIVKHSVLKYTYQDDDDDDYYLCTGALIANYQLDDTPYFLTANHCVNSSAEANSITFYFNYEAEICDGTTGQTDQTLSGATLKATADTHLDFSLLELSNVPPQSYRPFYVGWNRSTNNPTNTTCIHHPSGDIKKISKDNATPTTGSFPGYDANKHWKIYEWDLGTTEGGSSGSPLFDENQRIIGDLSGGEASCDYNYNDYYQKFSNAWNDYSSNAQNLKQYLDPTNTNTTLDGYDPYLNSSLQVPLNLTTSIFNENNIDLIWDENTSATGYKIYRNYYEIANITQSSDTTYSDQELATGIYSYYVTAIYNEGESYPSNNERVNVGVSVKELKNDEQILIYPNPNIGIFYIEVSNIEKLININIYNFGGKKIKCLSDRNNEKISIDLALFPASIYFIELVFEDKIIMRKIIKN